MLHFDGHSCNLSTLPVIVKAALDIINKVTVAQILCLGNTRSGLQTAVIYAYFNHKKGETENQMENI